jgi:diacylglycerol kinase (ATP)
MRRVQAQVHDAEALEVFARLDGRDISGRDLMLEAANLRYVGPNLHLAADSTPGDGQFDVVLVSEAERARLVHYLEHWQDNRERLAVLPTVKGSRLQLEWHGFPLHIDDKLKPKPDMKPKEMAGLVEARLEGDEVEFLVPA